MTLKHIEVLYLLQIYYISLKKYLNLSSSYGNISFVVSMKNQGVCLFS